MVDVGGLVEPTGVGGEAQPSGYLTEELSQSYDLLATGLLC